MARPKKQIDKKDFESLLIIQCNLLGMKMDAEVWTALRADIVKEMKRRKGGTD